MNDKRRRVGIVTIQSRANYGNRLQNYATAELIKKMGYQPVSLILDRSRDLLARIRSAARRALGKKLHEESMSAQRLEAFDRFNELMDFEVVDYASLHRNLDCDFYCAGSDQIWRFARFGFGEKWTFLQFADKDRRISLAPSFGVDTMTRLQSRRLGRYVDGYRMLSVREERGAEMIAGASGRKAEVICDPTLALSPEEWRSVSCDSLTPAVPYVFVYLLGDATCETTAIINAASRNGELEVVYLSDRERQGEPPAGPSEFLSLVDHAQHVVTDSFHASIFSSLFRTPLTIVRRNAGSSAFSNMFGRIETLAAKLGIEHMVYESQGYDPDRADDFEGVAENIERERKRIIDYLGLCLNA